MVCDPGSVHVARAVCGEVFQAVAAREMYSDSDWRPARQGLYHPQNEKDSCGVGMVADLTGAPGRSIVEGAMQILENLDHRGARGCELDTGDGAGILCGMPDRFFRRVAQDVGIQLPAARKYAVGNIFLAQMEGAREEGKRVLADVASRTPGIQLLGWRSVPVNSECLGKTAKSFEPHIEQCFIAADEKMILDTATFEAALFVLRKKASNAAARAGFPFYICSLSCRVVNYKGMLTCNELSRYFEDLVQEDFESHVALVHSRFSTNTFPAWRRSHPFRYIAHNGEINTLRGNVNAMRAREGLMNSELLGAELQECFPIVDADQSDSGIFDNTLEILTLSGRSLPESLLMMQPPAWEKSPSLPQELRDYYKYHAAIMEPWDGPALICFTDGDVVGASLDRNGLRPCRYYITKDQKLICASESGVLSNIPPKDIEKKGRLQPGRMFYSSFAEQRIINDDEFKQRIATANPYGDWIQTHGITMEELRQYHIRHGSSDVSGRAHVQSRSDDVGFTNLAKRGLPSQGSGFSLSILRDREFGGGNLVSPRGERATRLPLLRAFGYTQEAVEMLLRPMGTDGQEALGSMGNDTPLGCLSKQPRLVYDFFYQLFAQVTNPPIDPIRESVVMSLSCWIGPEQNALGKASPAHCQRLWLEHPCLTPEDMDSIYGMNGLKGWHVKVIDSTFPKREGSGGLVRHLNRVCNEAVDAVRGEGCQIIILSDRSVAQERVQLPALLASGAVHQTLVREKLRSLAGIVVDSGEPHEVAHHGLLITFGADAVCPYMAYEALLKLRADDHLPEGSWPDAKLAANYQKSVGFGLLKVMAKMGVSTLQSYKGAQIAEAIGLHQDVAAVCFTGIISQLGGLGFEQIGERTLRLHERGFPSAGGAPEDYLFNTLANEGRYHWRQGSSAEKHLNDPMVIAKLQEAARTNSRHAYASFSALHNSLVKQSSLRGQFDFKPPRQYGRTPIPLESVEPASEIIKRFRTGAMSYGSISMEAHSTLAVAMNRIGGFSNTGEGGEDPARFDPMPNGDSMKSAIKQVASGRFGVTIEYLANSAEIQIKMAQGAKPGEGGELPGNKVGESIAKTRGSTPGVGLISPPPHHDIYSIEDLAQLIYDCKNANPEADVSVKLVSEVGVGVVAAGVAKCKADHILVSGADGGTGASKWTGIKHAGAPWELGLAETHQTLVLNGLRGRVSLETDGQLRTGRDVIMAALLGAERFGFATAPLIAMGCIMMRKCHLNTCPVGIATQDPVLRQKFEGMPEHVVNYLMLVAEEARTLMAKLGFRSFNELIGHAEVLRVDPSVRDGLMQYLPILMPAHRLPDAGKIGQIENHKMYKQDHFPMLQKVIDRTFVSECPKTFRYGEPSFHEQQIRNIDRSVGTLLSHELYKRWGYSLAPGTCHIKLVGTSGQSFGAFGVKGLLLELEGDTQDFFGKGLSGATCVVYPPKESLDLGFVAEDNIIAGNTCLYGATAGVALIRGVAAERFAVRNSGAWAVVEGVGDHCCEYMTGGRVAVLGETGTNFGAGMSGGLAWVWDPKDSFTNKVNAEMVELSRMSSNKPHPVYTNDIQDLKELLEAHLRFTNSTVAKDILGRWPQSAHEFVRVFPNDYMRVLQQRAADGNPIKMPVLSEWLPNGAMVAPKPIARGSPKAAPKAPPLGLPELDIEEMGKFAKGNRLQVDDPKALTNTKRGFIHYDRAEIPKRGVQDRVGDFSEVTDKISEAQIMTQASRCMDCGTPFCHQSVTDKSGCPLGNLIPEWNDLVAQGSWHEAFRRLMQTNNFPEFTGRVCPAPCEGSCVLGIIDDPVSIKSVELTIIDKAYEMGWMRPTPVPFRTGKTVAIIGSGPSGLAAADQLNKMGHLVTVFERADRAGGLMMYGVPNMKTDKVNVVERRLAIMRAEGITFITGKAGHVGGVHGDTEVAADDTVVGPTAQQVLDEHDAVLLSTGATVGRDMQAVPGRDLQGIHLAMEYLKMSTKSLLDGGSTGKGWRQWWGSSRDVAAPPPLDAAGKRVIIIGGGDTGNDCIGTAVRQGARSIVNLELMPQPPATRAPGNNWPHWPHVFKVDYGHEEARDVINNGEDIRSYGVSTKEFIGQEGGVVTGIKIVSVQWERVDGQMRMREVPGSERVLEADIVLLALGFTGPENPLASMFDVDLDDRGNYKATFTDRPGDFATSNPKVFTAGDCRRGQSLVVWAIREGRGAAQAIHQRLIGADPIVAIGSREGAREHVPSVASAL